MKIECLSSEELSDIQIKAINALTDATWPETIPKKTEWPERKAAFLKRNLGKQCHFIYHKDKLAAYAESFGRKVNLDNTPFTLMGIGAVCVDKAYRGLGLGAKIVKKCFERIDQGDYEVCLFQTGVPGFYKKLNCRLVHNAFIDSTHPTEPKKNPFWDEYTMIYPKDFNWPNGSVDLLGAGY